MKLALAGRGVESWGLLCPPDAWQRASLHMGSLTFSSGFRVEGTMGISRNAGLRGLRREEMVQV